LDTVLDERGIPHLNCSYDDSVCDGLFQLQKGWGVLYAAEEHRQEIKEIHTELDPSLEEREPEQP
jgi:hypothetical protein